MSSIHDRLAHILSQFGFPGQIIGQKQLQAWYRQAGYPEERLFPAHHARGEQGEAPPCARCQAQPLLEKVKVQGHRHPQYRILSERLPHESLSDHELLQQLLQVRQGESESLAGLRLWLIQRLRERAPERLQAVQNLHRHTPEGGCMRCAEAGPLLLRQARQHYLILPPPERVSRLQSVQISVPEIWQLAQEHGLWEKFHPPLVQWLSEKTGLSLQRAQQEMHSWVQAPAQQIRQNTPHLVERLWASQSLSDWQSWHGVYFQHVTQPVRELVLETVLPDCFAQAQLQAQPLLEEFLHWMLGGRPHLEKEFKERQAELAARGAYANNLFAELREGDSDATRLKTALALPGFSDSWVLATGLLALLWPQAYLTVSPPLLWGLAQLEKAGCTQTGLRSLTLGELQLPEILRLQNWARQECQRRNAHWGQDWLTPRRLDRCLYALRDGLPESLAKVIAGKQARVKMTLREAELESLLKRICLSPPEPVLVALRSAAAELRRLPPLPDCLKPFLPG